MDTYFANLLVALASCQTYVLLALCSAAFLCSSSLMLCQASLVSHLSACSHDNCHVRPLLALCSLMFI